MGQPERPRGAPVHRQQRLTPRRQLAGLARFACAALTLALVCGCTGGNPENSATDVGLRHLVVECRDIIDTVADLVPDYTAHGSDGGFVALPTRTLQLGRSGSADSGHEDYRFAKFGLLVRRSRQALLEIVSAPDDAFFNYGSGAFGPADTLTAGPCDSHGPACDVNSAEYVGGWPCGADRGEWMVWAGGIWVNEPGCVEVIVSSEDEEIPVQLAVGAPCNGQP